MPPIARRTLPPFRADQVGSLIRPAALIEARKAADAGKLPAEELRRNQVELPI